MTKLGYAQTNSKANSSQQCNANPTKFISIGSIYFEKKMFTYSFQQIEHVTAVP